MPGLATKASNMRWKIAAVAHLRKLFEDRIPLVKRIRNIPPLGIDSNNPKNSFDEKTWVASGLTGVGCPDKAMPFDQRSLGIGQNQTDQGCSFVVCNLKAFPVYVGSPIPCHASGALGTLAIPLFQRKLETL